MAAYSVVGGNVTGGVRGIDVEGARWLGSALADIVASTRSVTGVVAATPATSADWHLHGRLRRVAVTADDLAHLVAARTRELAHDQAAATTALERAADVATALARLAPADRAIAALRRDHRDAASAFDPGRLPEDDRARRGSSALALAASDLVDQSRLPEAERGWDGRGVVRARLRAAGAAAIAAARRTPDGTDPLVAALAVALDAEDGAAFLADWLAGADAMTVPGLPALLAAVAGDATTGARARHQLLRSVLVPDAGVTDLAWATGVPAAPVALVRAVLAGVAALPAAAVLAVRDPDVTGHLFDVDVGDRGATVGTVAAVGVAALHERDEGAAAVASSRLVASWARTATDVRDAIVPLAEVVRLHPGELMARVDAAGDRGAGLPHGARVPTGATGDLASSDEVAALVRAVVTHDLAGAALAAALVAGAAALADRDDATTAELLLADRDMLLAGLVDAAWADALPDLTVLDTVGGVVAVGGVLTLSAPPAVAAIAAVASLGVWLASLRADGRAPTPAELLEHAAEQATAGLPRARRRRLDAMYEQGVDVVRLDERIRP